MRVPIQYALSYPNRLERVNAKRLNLAEIGKLHFEEMNYTRYLGIVDTNCDPDEIDVVIPARREFY